MLKFKKPFKSKVLNKGFTLIEVLVVVVIIAILAMMVVPKIMNRPEQARVVRAKNDIASIQNALDLYKLDNGLYPSTSQGLQALISKPTGDPQPQNYQSGGYLKQKPIDPWGHPYQYLNPGKHGEDDVWTFGPTGQAGSQGGKNQEIGNWMINQ